VEAPQFHSTTQSHWSRGLGGQRFASRGCTNSRWNLVSPFSYIGDPDMIDHWRPQSPCRQLDASLGFMSTKWKASSVITHCLSGFHSTPCRSSFSSRHSDQLEPRSSCWGGALWRPCNFTPTTQSHWSSGSTVSFLSRGSVVCVLGIHKLTMEPGFSC
jgi:hypothetical protein